MLTTSKPTQENVANKSRIFPVIFWEKPFLRRGSKSIIPIPIIPKIPPEIIFKPILSLKNKNDATKVKIGADEAIIPALTADENETP